MLNHALLGVAAGGGYQMENSLLFRGAQYLTRTPTVAGSVKSATFNVWLRLSDIATAQCLFFAGTDINNREYAYFEGSSAGYTLAWGCYTAGVRQWFWRGAAKFRDPTGFVMLTFVRDLDNVSAAGRLRVYLNGQLLTADSGTTVYPETTASRWWGAVTPHAVGCQTFNSVWYFRGILSEPAFADGAALSPDVFGQIDPVTGSWRPKAVSGVDFGTNGFRLGKPWDAADLGGDVSGRGNDWAPVGFAASDVVSDSPTNVYATLNALSIGSTIGLSGGNLAPTSAGSWGSTLGTLRMTTGKWFWAAANMVTNGNLLRLGIANGTYAGVPANLGTYAGNDANSWIVQGNGTAQIRSQHNAAYLSSGTVPVTLVDADCVVCAFDAGAKKLWLGLHDISASTTYWMDSAGTLRTTNEPALGTNQTYTVTGTEWFPVAACAVTGMTCDFGQKSFGGIAPPSGFRTLCTANLPATTGQTSGTFTGNASADGPCVFTGAVPETLSVNGNAVIWGTHADKLATGFKIRTASLAYNASGANSWAATYDKKPTVGPKGRVPANAQSN